MLWCRGALFSFQFWDGKQNLVPNMWQVVFANVSIEGRVVDTDVNVNKLFKQLTSTLSKQTSLLHIKKQNGINPKECYKV